MNCTEEFIKTLWRGISLGIEIFYRVKHDLKHLTFKYTMWTSHGVLCVEVDNFIPSEKCKQAIYGVLC